MIQINLDNQNYNLPQSWADVPPERLAELLRLVYFTPGTGDYYLEIIRLALNVKPRVWKALMQKHFSPKIGKKARAANAIVLHDLYRFLGWMETEPIQKQPFPSIAVKGLTLLLPEEKFLTMSYGELTDAYIHFLVYLRQLVPGNDHLHLLISTICRPARSKAGKGANWNGDEREAYNEFIVKQRAKAVAELDEGVKMAILLYFAGNMKAVLEQYQIFGEEGSESEEEYPGQGFVKNTHLLAQKGIFGTLNETKAVNLHEVLLFLEEHSKDLLAEAERKKAEQ
ncbi:hypothetical protein [Spirosoma sp.]|uniref:hypothetical protein n=1 Tax=Spirosoma sp. TaxID=1899569 RepID=UPI002635C497|nr:hypothetical protein [Spirosoma sp.]MCX6216571.1 hypothetical protein [Spirosoma sp.]